MRRRENFPSKQADVNMTPMLDVVFILLIFFVVTATFLTEFGLDMRTPNDGPACTDCPPPVVVQIDENNMIIVNQVPTQADAVLTAVYSHRVETPRSGVLIQVHDEADHGTVVRILDNMREIGAPATVQRAQVEEA
jgi:biopolymer transport protein ExbD